MTKVTEEDTYLDGIDNCIGTCFFRWVRHPPRFPTLYSSAECNVYKGQGPGVGGGCPPGNKLKSIAKLCWVRVSNYGQHTFPKYHGAPTLIVAKLMNTRCCVPHIGEQVSKRVTPKLWMLILQNQVQDLKKRVSSRSGALVRQNKIHAAAG